MKSKVILIIFVILVIGSYKIFKPTIRTSTLEPSSTPTILQTYTPSPSPTPSPTASPEPSNTPTMVPFTPKPSNTPTIKPLISSGPSTWTFDLSNTKVVTDTANDNDCATNCPVANLQTFVTKNGGFFGVNGTYFCPASYPDCSSKTNSFDFPVWNTRLNHWINGGNLFWNSRSIIYFDGSGGHYLQNAKDFSGGLTAGIVNHPGLLSGGNIQIDENQSGLSDKQKARGTKVGIGLIGQQKVIVMVAKNVTMREFALAFKSAGATDALNLDVGGSLAIFNNGRYVYGPGRDIPNAIIFVRK